MKSDSVVWPIRMKRALIERFKAIAEDRSLGASEIIRDLISKYVVDYELKKIRFEAKNEDKDGK